jgi:hypothetical protein
MPEGLCLNFRIIPVPRLLNPTFNLHHNMHLLFCCGNGFGPAPSWDLALVELVDLGCGAAV